MAKFYRRRKQVQLLGGDFITNPEFSSPFLIYKDLVNTYCGRASVLDASNVDCNMTLSELFTSVTLWATL